MFPDENDQDPEVAKKLSAKARREEQLEQLRRIRELERVLDEARKNLKQSLDKGHALSLVEAAELNIEGSQRKDLRLTKEDYLNMVDLYYYAFRTPDFIGSSHKSPTPLIYNESETNRGRMSKRMRPMEESEIDWDAAVDPEFREEVQGDMEDFEREFVRGTRERNSLLTPFVDCLLEDEPSPKKLFDLYRRFPKPGVAYLPTPAIRLFLHRMSTHPDKRSEFNMVRYMSIIEDMQRAKLPITNGEWTSAVYLVGRTFKNVSETNMMNGLHVWKIMEQGAGVQSTDVTFNVLLDLTVKAGKYVIADMVLDEMFRRGLHLNRIGRVIYMWYQGALGNGDGVREAYHDFVNANEIVDTLVLNCVIVSLIRAQEPVAAEQIYERMKTLQERLQKDIPKEQYPEWEGEGSDVKPSPVSKYPSPGTTKLGNRPASNTLRTTLRKASELGPEERGELQATVPLTPDHVTYRIMIDLYAIKTGEIDRLAVILREMTLFRIGMNPLYFKMMFKGFSIHGGTKYSKWTPKLLEIVWQACLEGMQRRQNRRVGQTDPSHIEDEGADEEEDDGGIEWREGEGLKRDSEQSDNGQEVKGGFSNQSEDFESSNETGKDLKTRWRESWQAFIHDFAAPPQVDDYRHQANMSRRRRDPDFFDTLRWHASGNAPRPDPSAAVPGSNKPRVFDQPLSDDVDEEYPSASRILPPPGFADSSPDEELLFKGHIKPSLFLIKWILHAHSKVIPNREKLEDVWYECQRVWKPKNELEKELILRWLAKDLKECDMRGGTWHA
ncbi:MAG: hypothetical protein Q9227_006578 [Pyrenula ochraceoflavens]